MQNSVVGNIAREMSDTNNTLPITNQNQLMDFLRRMWDGLDKRIETNNEEIIKRVRQDIISELEKTEQKIDHIKVEIEKSQKKLSDNFQKWKTDTVNKWENTFERTKSDLESKIDENVNTMKQVVNKSEEIQEIQNKIEQELGDIRIHTTEIENQTKNNTKNITTLQHSIEQMSKELTNANEQVTPLATVELITSSLSDVRTDLLKETRETVDNRIENIQVNVTKKINKAMHITQTKTQKRKKYHRKVRSHAMKVGDRGSDKANQSSKTKDKSSYEEQILLKKLLNYLPNKVLLPLINNNKLSLSIALEVLKSANYPTGGAKSRFEARTTYMPNQHNNDENDYKNSNIQRHDTHNNVRPVDRKILPPFQQNNHFSEYDNRGNDHTNMSRETFRGGGYNMRGWSYQHHGNRKADDCQRDDRLHSSEPESNQAHDNVGSNNHID